MFSLNCGTYYLHLFCPANKFSQAIELYSQAIELNSSNAVYWANRAFAHTKLEEYGSAVQDATKAIEIDPRYSKVSDDASDTSC
jgi:tetratricopeptide (TPR) repeat protein